MPNLLELFAKFLHFLADRIKSEPYLFITLLVVVGIVVLLILYYVINQKQPRKASKSLFRKIDEVVQLNSDLKEKDIEVIINSQFRGDSEFVRRPKGITADVLEDYLAARSYIKDTYFDKYSLILKMIKIKREEEPDIQVFTEEANLILSMNKWVLNDDRDLIGFQLNQLKDKLVARDLEFRKLKKVNRITVPLTVIGTLLTLVFGIFGIISADFSSIIESDTDSADVENVEQGI